MARCVVIENRLVVISDMLWIHFILCTVYLAEVVCVRVRGALC